MDSLGAIVTFVRAAELRSFTAAARSLGVTPSGVGKAVGRLEEELGVRLLHRTTRRIGLTDEGALFFEQCRRVLDDLEAARAQAASRSQAPRGHLRVSLPITIGRQIVVPALGRFVARHPEVSLQLNLTDRRVNLLEDGVDVALRVGALHDSSLVARAVGVQEMVVVASPAYLATTSLRSLGDLALCRCVVFRVPQSGHDRPWALRVEGRVVDWRPPAALRIDDGDGVAAAAVAGLGAAQVPDHFVRRELASGALVEVLPELRPEPLPIQAVSPSQRNLPARSRAFIDFLAALPDLGPRRGEAA